MRTMNLLAAAATVAVSCLSAANGVQAAEEVKFVFNWFPTADHSPYFYARDNGWYADVGIDLEIETAKGSGASSQRIGAGQVPMGVADLPHGVYRARQGGRNRRRHGGVRQFAAGFLLA